MLSPEQTTRYLAAAQAAPLSDVLPYLLTRCPDDPAKPQYSHSLRAGMVALGCGGTPTVDPNTLGIPCPQWAPWHARRAAVAIRANMSKWDAPFVHTTVRYAAGVLDGTVPPTERSAPAVAALLGAESHDAHGATWDLAVSFLTTLADGSVTGHETGESYGSGPSQIPFHDHELAARVTLLQLSQFCAGDVQRAAVVVTGSLAQIAALPVPPYVVMPPRPARAARA